jgi:hypothetical protein
MGRRLLAWLVTLPLAAAGVLVGHALAYASTGRDPGALHAYLEHLPQVAAVLATVGLVGLAVQQGSSRRASWPYAIAALAGFAGMEHVEVLAHNGSLPWLLTDTTFLLGLLLQVPIALVCLAVARWLLAGAGTARRSRPPRVSALALLLADPAPARPVPVSAPGRRGRAPPVPL